MIKICEVIAESIGEQFSCSVVGDFVRIRTPYLYPDGDVIDIFVKQKNEEIIFTDLGETLRWLQMQSVSENLSDRADEIIDDTLQTYGIEQYKGMFVLRARNNGDLSRAITDLSQAVFRISDVYFTFKTRTPKSFSDEVKDFLDREEFNYEENAKFNGESGRSRKVDFCVKCRGSNSSPGSLVYLLSSMTTSESNRKADFIFSSFSDLRYLNYNHISLFDDQFSSWSKKNEKLLSNISAIAFWSRREEFKEILNSTQKRF